MNAILWILQILLALHTIVGAVWKFSHSEQGIPSLKTLPHGVWLALIPIELLCGVALVIPAVYRPLAILAPIAALVIAAEMLLFCAVNLRSGTTDKGPIFYWLVVAIVCAFVAYGRFVLLLL